MSVLSAEKGFTKKSPIHFHLFHCQFWSLNKGMFCEVGGEWGYSLRYIWFGFRVHLASLAQSESTCFKAERSLVQIPAWYSGWPGHYNNVGCSARLEISFVLKPVTEDKKGHFTLLYQGSMIEAIRCCIFGQGLGYQGIMIEVINCCFREL